MRYKQTAIIQLNSRLTARRRLHRRTFFAYESLEALASARIPDTAASEALSARTQLAGYHHIPS